MWLGAAVFNSVFVAFWDLERDWAIPAFSNPRRAIKYLWLRRRHPGTGPLAGIPSESLMYSSRSFYAWAVVSNLVLR